MGRSTNGDGDDVVDIGDLLETPAQGPAPASAAQENGGASAQRQTGDGAPPHAETLEKTLEGYQLGALLSRQLRMPGSAHNMSAIINDYESLATTDRDRLFLEMRGLLRDIAFNRRYFGQPSDITNAPAIQQSLLYNLAIRELGYFIDVFKSEFEHIDRIVLRNNVRPGEIGQRLPRIMDMIQTSVRKLKAKVADMESRMARLDGICEGNPKHKDDSRYRNFMNSLELRRKALVFLSHNYPPELAADGGANYPLHAIRGKSVKDKPFYVLAKSLLPAQIYVPTFDSRFALGIIGSGDSSKVALYYRNRHITIPATPLDSREKAAALAETMMKGPDEFYRYVRKVRLV
ncbi:hypothetical protein HYX09_02480 [Candidatus Woesearchaeota archaeon]|nr:hypothetical protein [Candidatus Woesearchaeota archaeon]